MMQVNRGRKFSECAVLYRMNAQSNALEYALRRNGMPYKVVGGTKFYDRAEVKDMLAYLCVLNNPLDDLRLRRIVNNPVRGIGNTSMEKVQTVASQQGLSLYETMRNADLFPELKAPAAKLLKFADLVDGLRKLGNTLALPEFYDAVCDQTGYTQALKQKDDMESRGRLENVEELKSSIAGFLAGDPEDATLSGFLNEIALYTDLDSMDGSDDNVTLMTIHSAKGLEFPSVYVVGMEDGIFPGMNSMFDQDELEEERRLCYVAMTRAKEHLTLTNARQRMLYGRTSANRASRFLDEIPEETYEWAGRPEPRMEEDSGGFGDSWDRFGGSSGSSFGGNTSSGAGAPRYPTGGGFGGSAAQRSPARSSSVYPVSATETKPAPAPRPAAKPAGEPLMQVAQGDTVSHTAFGKGTVLSVKPMGGDALIEVAFETKGTKKLMLKSAGAHMAKL